jgi:hypothetical protein
MPPTVQPSFVTTDVLWTVSVVLMAMAAFSPPCSLRAAAAFSTPGSSLSMGSRTPMRPVEATATSPAPIPRTSAAFSAVAWVSWKPLGPVQALAPPELSTTAVSSPLLRTCSDHRTGAALTRLDVKTPAAARRGPVLTTRARSGLPFSLIPAAMPAAVNPFAAVTLTALLRSLRRGGG